MAIHRLAVIIKSSSENDENVLLVRQVPPPRLPEKEYADYVDSDLWDLPSTPLTPLPGESRSSLVIDGADSCADRLSLDAFDVESAIDQVLSQVGVERSINERWVFWKYLEEAEFGLEPLVNTVFLCGTLKLGDRNVQGVCKWMSIPGVLELLLEVKPGNERIGPLVAAGNLIDSADLRGWEVPRTLHFQEYPPGVILVPLRSRTQRPFVTTNLVVIAPKNATDSSEDSSFAANGDALLIDPGCHSGCHAELMEIVAALPRKLVVFLTHHHFDHVDGLSVVQKCNPDATLLAHEKTMSHMGKDAWSLGYTPISGGEYICIGSQKLVVIFAPGHTDGHMALLHVSTNSLIVGDHCVGQGSAVLDINSGGNMQEYFQTTYNILELSPHILIPMHGRVNFWPKRMLCGYLKHRRERESSILDAIENGADTLFDIIAKTYADVDMKLWLPASSNVRLHVEFLAQQDRLPKEFSLQKFQVSCRLDFPSRWIWLYLKSHVLSKAPEVMTIKFLTAIAVAVFAVLYIVTCKIPRREE